MKSNRKLVGYVDKECVDLLYKFGILDIGRGSKYSDWLRKKILMEFAGTDYYERELAQCKVDLELTNKNRQEQDIIWKQKQQIAIEIQEKIRNIKERRNKLDKLHIPKSDLALLENFSIAIKEKGRELHHHEQFRKQCSGKYKKITFTEFKTYIDLVQDTMRIL